DFNRVRAEVFFPATLDELMGVDFTKQKLEPKQAALDKLRDALKNEFRSLGQRIRSQRVKVENTEVSHDEAARQIGQKAHLLAKPKLKIEERKSPTEKDSKRPEEQSGTKVRKNFRNTQEKPVALP